MSKHIPAPISEGSPYMPVMTYTIACPMVMIIPNTAKVHQKMWNRHNWHNWNESCYESASIRVSKTSLKLQKGTWQLLKIATVWWVIITPTFLSSVEEGSVLRSVSHLNDLGTSQQLHDEAWGDNGWDTQLHQSTWRTQSVSQTQKQCKSARNFWPLTYDTW